MRCNRIEEDLEKKKTTEGGGEERNSSSRRKRGKHCWRFWIKSLRFAALGGTPAHQKKGKAAISRRKLRGKNGWMSQGVGQEKEGRGRCPERKIELITTKSTFRKNRRRMGEVTRGSEGGSCSSLAIGAKKLKKGGRVKKRLTTPVEQKRSEKRRPRSTAGRTSTPPTRKMGEFSSVKSTLIERNQATCGIREP